MVYKYINIIGTSSKGIDDAVRDAISEATRTINNIEWAELGRVTFKVIDNNLTEFQAEVKIGFKIEKKD
jgi:flavin-binding protein dodecin